MSGPQTGRAQATLVASPSNSLESACQKAGSRFRAVFRPAVSTVRQVSASSASRARPPTGIVAWHAACHPATQNRRRTCCLPAPSAREREACPWGTTALYEVVRDNLETLFGAIDDGALAVRIPRHARKELLAYLDCGLLCGPRPGFALAALPD